MQAGDEEEEEEEDEEEYEEEEEEEEKTRGGRRRSSVSRCRAALDPPSARPPAEPVEAATRDRVEAQ